MVLKELIKKLFKQKEPEKIEEITILKTKDKINSNLIQMRKEMETTKEDLTKKVNQYTIQLNNHINVLEKIDLSKRKENERLKQINLENIKIYISHVQKLLENFDTMRNVTPEEYHEKIPQYINQFENTSRKSFEKSTLFVGKEMEVIPSILRELSKEYNKHCEENRHFFIKNKNLVELQNLIDNRLLIKNSLTEKEKQLSTFKEKAKQIQQEINARNNEKEKILASSEYLTAEKEKKERQKALEALKEEARLIKEKLNMKSLATIFHSDEKKNELIKKYNSNFIDSLENDESSSFAELVSITYPSENFTEQINTLRKKHLELKVSPIFYIDEQLIKIEHEIQKAKEELIFSEKINDVDKKKTMKIQEQALHNEELLKQKALEFNWKIKTEVSE